MTGPRVRHAHAGEAMRSSTAALFSTYAVALLTACIIEPDPAFDDLAASSTGSADETSAQPGTGGTESSTSEGGSSMQDADAESEAGTSTGAEASSSGCDSTSTCECVDPCVNRVGSATYGDGVCTLQLEIPIDRDTWVDEANPGTNHGGSLDLEIDSNAAVLEVSLLAWSNPAWPPGTSFVEAEFVAVVTNVGDEASWHLVDEVWDESTVTWIDRPSWGEPRGTLSVQNSLVVFDVRAALELGASFQGVALTMGGSDADGIVLASRETELGPFVRITAEFPATCE